MPKSMLRLTICLFISSMLMMAWNSSARAAAIWYVALAGDDSNPCNQPDLPCKTFSAAIAKAVAGDTIYAAADTWERAEGKTITLDKDISIIGGWTGDFSARNAYSIVKGSGGGQVFAISASVTANIEYITITDTYNTAFMNDGLLTLRHIQVTNMYIGSGGDNILNRNIMILEDSLIENNQGGYGGKGGITSYHPTSATLILRRVSMHKNTPNSIMASRTNVLIENSSLTYSSGDAIILYNEPSRLVINNSNISNNGGIGVNAVTNLCDAPDCTVELSNVTLSLNKRGLQSNDNVTLRNTILAGNTGATSPTCLGGAITSLGYNLFGDITDCVINLQPSDQVGVDPLLGATITPPGKPGYVTLLASSPAINAGNPSGCLDDLGAPITHDVRNLARSGVCDIGAYEYAPPGPASLIYLVSGSDQFTLLGQGFTNPLKLIALDNQGTPAEGSVVTFSAPASGPSVVFAGSGTYTTSHMADTHGLVVSSIFTANLQAGIYSIIAGPPALTSTVTYDMKNVAGFYVTNSGSDLNDCMYPESPCKTMTKAIEKAVPGATIYVTAELRSENAFTINKAVNVSGGWNSAFTQQVGKTILDGNGSWGGQIYADKNSIIERFWMRNGNANGFGCANATVTLKDSIISGSKATYQGGGGVYMDKCYLTLVNVSISGNSSVIEGGGIYVYAGDASNSRLRLYNVTIALNSTAGGSTGGLYAGNTPVEMQNTLIGGNTAGGAQAECLATAITSNGYNLLSNTAGCSFTPAAGDVLDVPAGIGPTPQITGLAALQYNSPAVNGGNPAGCTDETGNLLTQDVRYIPYQGICDIGAFEYIAPGPEHTYYVTNGDLQHVQPGDPFPNPLTGLVLDSQGNLVHDTPVTFLGPASGSSVVFAASGSHAITVNTTADGTVSSGALSANMIGGVYTVTATTSGMATPAVYHLVNALWFLSPGGNDSNTCMTPADPCASLTAIVQKSAFVAGDEVFAQAGVYTGSGSATVAIVTKTLILHGGYDATFSSQIGHTVFDGQGVRPAFYLSATGVSELDHVSVINGKPIGMDLRSSVIFTDGEISQNQMGIALGNGTTNTLRQLKVHHNFPNGGIVNSGALTLWNSVVHDNKAWQGGGLYNLGYAYVHNTTFTSNRAEKPEWIEQGEGGGIYASTGSLTVLYNVSIINNSSDHAGGGIFSATRLSFKLYNTLIALNQANEGFDCAGVVTSFGYNIMTNPIDCTITPTAGDQIGAWQPGVAPFSDYGGGLPSIALYSGSPALDGGNPTGCQDMNGNMITTDQRGQPRHQDGDGDGIARCDIGAFESAYPALPGPPQNIWYVTTSGNDKVTCNDPSRPCKTINGALAKAAPMDSIRVVWGTFTASSGTDVVTIDKDIILSGGWDTSFTTQVSHTTISGSGARRPVKVNRYIRVSMNRFILTATNYSAMQLFSRNFVTINNVKFQLNNASGWGGGIFISGGSYVTISDSVFSSNSTNSEGGALFMDHAIVTIENTTFSGNSSLRGGGIYVNGGTLKLYNCTIKNNNASYTSGGGIYNIFGNVEIFDSLIEGNSAQEYGGGVAGANLVINSRFINNRANLGGGGISGGNRIMGSAFIGNKAPRGAAIYSDSNSYDFTIVNTTLHSNQASNQGGAIYSERYLYIFNSTLSLNSATNSGGGIYFSGTNQTSRIANSIIYNNTAPAAPDCFGAPGSDGYNLLGSLAGCGYPLSTGDLIGVNPLMSLVGGNTALYFTLQANSPAIDAGNPAGCRDFDNSLITTSQNGVYRPNDGNKDWISICDIGAYEFASLWQLFLTLIRR